MRRAVNDAKVNAVEKYGRKGTECFQNKEMFWKEVNWLRKGIAGKEKRIRIEDGTMLIEKNVGG